MVCNGDRSHDHQLSVNECVDKCKSTHWCNCISWNLSPDKKCRLEEGTDYWSGSSNYSAITMVEANLKCAFQGNDVVIQLIVS